VKKGERKEGGREEGRKKGRKEGRKERHGRYERPFEFLGLSCFGKVLQLEIPSQKY
jgi:hypothetical protein